MAEFHERDPALREYIEAVEVCRDVHSGTLRLRKVGQKYLPIMPEESVKAWKSRKQASVLYEGFTRTVDGLVGMAFRRDPTLSEATPNQIVEQSEDIDMAGNHLSVFMRDAFEDQMVDGNVFIFVDWPTVEPGVFSNPVDERAANLRPYWIRIPRLNVLGHDTERFGGRDVTTHFRYVEQLYRRVEGKQVPVKRIRQYEPAGDNPTAGVFFRIWEKAEDQDWEVVEPGRPMNISQVPLAVSESNRRSRPPLEALAHESVLHWQLRSDRTNLIRASHVPIFAVWGAELNAVTFGPGVGLEGPENASAEWIEITGSGLEHSKDELADIRQNMASLGLSQLERQTRQAETARAREIEKAEADSKLAVALRALRDAADNALLLHAEWIDESDAGAVDLNTDFDSLIIDWQMVQQLRGLVGEGSLSLETMWERLQKGEVLGDTFDPDVERERIRQEQNDGLVGAM
jgi:hypothetical protein